MFKTFASFESVDVDPEQILTSKEQLDDFNKRIGRAPEGDDLIREINIKKDNVIINEKIKNREGKTILELHNVPTKIGKDIKDQTTNSKLEKEINVELQ